MVNCQIICMIRLISINRSYSCHHHIENGEAHFASSILYLKYILQDICFFLKSRLNDFFSNHPRVNDNFIDITFLNRAQLIK